MLNLHLEEEVAVVMDHVGNLYNSLTRYFGALEQMGYYDSSETMNLIIYLFIVNEIFEGRLGMYLDDEGLAKIEHALRCIYNGCLIDAVRDNIRLKEGSVYHSRNIRLRYSEDDIVRFTEDDLPRPPEAET